MEFIRMTDETVLTAACDQLWQTKNLTMDGIG